MGLNKKDQEKVSKTLIDAGLTKQSDGSFANDKGDKARFSPTGNSIKMNGGTYNSTSSVNNSNVVKK